MQLPVNTFKHALRDRVTQIGFWVGMTDTVSVEIAAGAGFDWLALDAEHAPYQVPTLLRALQTVAAYRTHPVVRLPVGEATLIKQVLDIGAQTLLVPMVETAEQAAALVAATRYPPEGIRGVGTGLARAARWTRIADYVAQAGDETCLLVQVESRRGLVNLDEIARVPGVDGVFIGPSDLAASLGHPGHPGHGEVRSAVRAAIATIVAAGKPAGILSADEAVARDCIAQGCCFVAVGTDTVLYARATEALARRFRGDRPPPEAG